MDSKLKKSVKAMQDNHVATEVVARITCALKAQSAIKILVFAPYPMANSVHTIRSVTIFATTIFARITHFFQVELLLVTINNVLRLISAAQAVVQLTILVLLHVFQDQTVSHHLMLFRNTITTLKCSVSMEYQFFKTELQI